MDRSKLIMAMSSYEGLFSYCLTRSLPPLPERHKYSSKHIGMCIERAHRWYRRLLPIARKIWANP